MKICLSLVHLTALIFVLAPAASAQVDLPKAQIVTLTLEPQDVTVLHLRRGYVSSVLLPEEVSSVVLGDPGAFRAEHSDAEPQLVFFKPTNPKSAETNALITTRSGHEVSLTLVSEGNSNRGGSIDYVLKYERPRSFLVGAAYSSFAIAETQALAPQSVPATNAGGKAGNDEQELLRQQRLDAPHWEGK
jgi:type IV secretory pathway VirB9-like protein